jgi:hypothetical protein
MREFHGGKMQKDKSALKGFLKSAHFEWGWAISRHSSSINYSPIVAMSFP